MKKVLITGSSGLVGKSIVGELLKNTDYVIYAASSKELHSCRENLHYLKNEELQNVMSCEHFDVILQLAFPRNVSEAQWASGMDFVAHILGLAKKYNVKKVINISSQSVYGWKRNTYAEENDSVYLNSPYTTGKYFSELMVNEMFADISHTNVRLSTIIGPETSERVPNKFFAQIVAGKEINVTGGKQIFSFLDIRDAAKGLARLVFTNNTLRPIYNLGTSEYATLLEIANMAVKIADKYGYSSRVNVEEADIVLNNMLNVSAMEEDFDWKAEYTLYEALENIFIENYINQKEA